MMTEDKITSEIKGAILDTYNTTGPGLTVTFYESKLCKHLKDRGLKYETHVDVPLCFDGNVLSCDLQANLMVEGQIPVLIKTADDLDKETEEYFHKELLTVIRLSHHHLGFLVNFNTVDINQSIWLKEDKFVEVQPSH